MTLSGTVTATTVNTDFDANRAALKTSFAAGAKRFTRSVVALGILSTTALQERSKIILLDDDARLIMLGISVVGGAYTITTTARLTALDIGAVGSGKDEYLHGDDVTSAKETTNATLAHTRTTQFQRTSGEIGSNFREIWLLRGVPYILSVETSDAANVAAWAQALMVLESGRRR